jgi:ppGpp synthetase/RelA/SpoT-type nucleotidyltranferase
MISVTADKLPNMHSTKFRGIPVVIQWPKGSTRVGEREDGTPFKTEMKASYGYIPDTVAAGDQERLDIYIGPNEEAENAYVVEQMKDDGETFDEYKVLLGFDSLEEAEETYLEHVEEQQLGDISEVPFEYLFDTVMEERGEDQEQEREEVRTEIEQDEQKVAGHDEHGEKLSVIDAFINMFKHEYDFYEEVAKMVQESLDQALQDEGIRAIVTSRAKKPNRLRGKLVKRDQVRHYQSFRDIKDDIVDLAGVRVALYLPKDREAVSGIIERLFAPVRAPKRFPENRGEGDGVGYVATHYLVQLRPENLHKKELRYADTNVEIQVASVLMHAWSEVTHDLTYKPQSGPLTEDELRMVNDLNDVVQKGESILNDLQESVEERTSETLRFELTAALTALAGKTASGGVTWTDTIAVATRLAGLREEPRTRPSTAVHSSYIRAKLALWKAHQADELDDRLRAYNETLPKRETSVYDETKYIGQAIDILHPGKSMKELWALPKAEYHKVIALAQDLKAEAQKTNP